MSRCGRVIAGLLALVWTVPALAGTLTITSNASDPAPRAAWTELVQRFQVERPDIQVKFTVYDHESYKKALRNWLTSASPDVIFWFAGERMRELVDHGLFEDLSDIAGPGGWPALRPGARDLVSVGGRPYGVPYAYYHVGLFYRRDLLQSAGVAPPRDWAELLAVCTRLRTSGIIPFAIGSKDLWPTAAWFDYLDLRSNGHDFHMALMAGQVPYTDARVRAVFGKWRELLDHNCFMPNHASFSWQESQALLYQGRAAMMLIGNYITQNFLPESRDLMDFAPFPTLDPAIAAAEDAPMNSLHIPARARNKADAKAFLAYVLRADVQEMLNQKLLLIPVNAAAAIPDDPFLQKGAALLQNAEHLSQFFDRDTSEDLATVAMKGFQEFMLRPERLDMILQTIERARQRIYKP